MKKIVYHVGDFVRVVNPRFVVRVGYPLVWTALIEEVEKSPHFEETRKAFGISNHHFATRDLVRGICMALVRTRNWGGKERRLHYADWEIPETHWKGLEQEILGKRIVKTGDYYPPSGGTDYWGDYEHEPGGLANERTHVLLLLGCGEIEACNVELVRRAE